MKMSSFGRKRTQNGWKLLNYAVEIVRCRQIELLRQELADSKDFLGKSILSPKNLGQKSESPFENNPQIDCYLHSLFSFCFGACCVVGCWISLRNFDLGRRCCNKNRVSPLSQGIYS